MVKAVTYSRTSTYDKQDVGMQEEAIKNYCEREGIEIMKAYSDRGVSGKKESRPEFNQLIDDLRNKVFDTLIVYKLDRVGRSLPHLVKLFEEFEKKEIKFIAITQNFNTTTPEGKLMLRMMMILAEYERELTVARIKDGLVKARKDGKGIGKRGKDKKKRRLSGYHLRWAKKWT